MRWLALLLVLVALGLAAWFAFDASRAAPSAPLTPGNVKSVESDVPRTTVQGGVEAAARIETAAPAHPADALTVTLVDETSGTPIGGASVRLARGFKDNRSRWNLEWRGESIATDASGIATIAALDDADCVAASKSGYVAKAVLVWGTEMRIALVASSTLFGRVLDAATRAPIAGAEVTLVDGEIPRVILPRSVTDASGAYRLEGLRFTPRFTTLDVRIDSCVPIEERVDLEVPGSHEHDILVDFAHGLRGRVVDAMSGAPIEGAKIEVTSSDSEDVATSDLTGSFVVRGLLESRVYNFVAHKIGYCGSWIAMESVAKFDFSRDIMLPLIQECSIKGTVTDSDGAPIARANVQCSQTNGSSYSRLWRSRIGILIDRDVTLGGGGEGMGDKTTDASGTFVMRGCRPWMSYTLVVTDPVGGATSRTLEQFDAPGDVRTRHFVLRRGTATVEGRVLVDGKPTEGSIQWTQASASGDAWIESRTDFRSGEYRFHNVVAGSVELVVNTFEQLAPTLRARVRLNVDGDASIVRHDFMLTTNRRRIEGIAFDGAEAKPGAGVTLVATNTKSRARIITVTDAAGAFAFDLPDDAGDRWWVEPQGAPWAHSGLEIVAGSNDVTLQLVRAD